MPRLVSLLFVLLSANALALPVTYHFEGSVTSFNFLQNGEAAAFDPSAPLVRPDGSIIFDGNTSVTGQFTIDLASLPAPWSCADLPLEYSMATEGAVYSHAPSYGCMNAVTSTPEQLSWHLEGPSLSNVGGLEATIQDFTFNFEEGLFKDGSFVLDCMIDSALGITGSIRGTITALNTATATPVPEPDTLHLLIPAGLLLLYRRLARKQG